MEHLTVKVAKCVSPFAKINHNILFFLHFFKFFNSKFIFFCKQLKVTTNSKNKNENCQNPKRENLANLLIVDDF